MVRLLVDDSAKALNVCYRENHVRSRTQKRKQTVMREKVIKSQTMRITIIQSIISMTEMEMEMVRDGIWCKQTKHRQLENHMHVSQSTTEI